MYIKYKRKGEGQDVDNGDSHSRRRPVLNNGLTAPPPVWPKTRMQNNLHYLVPSFL